MAAAPSRRAPRDDRIEGVAPVAHRGGARLGSQRGRRAHDPVAPRPVHCSAITRQLGRHRAIAGRSSSPARRATEREVGVHAEPRQRPATHGASTTVARPGREARAVVVPADRSPTARRRPPGSRRARRCTTSSSTSEREPLDRRPDIAPLLCLELIEAVDDLGVRSEGDDVGENRGVRRPCRRRRPRRPTRPSTRAPRTRSSSMSEGSCILGRKVYSIREGW